MAVGINLSPLYEGPWLLEHGDYLGVGGKLGGAEGDSWFLAWVAGERWCPGQGRASFGTRGGRMSYRLRSIVLVVPVGPPEGKVQKAVRSQE